MGGMARLNAKVKLGWVRVVHIVTRCTGHPLPRSEDANKRQLLSKLLVAGAAFAASHPKALKSLDQ